MTIPKPANDHPANAPAGEITRILDALRRGEVNKGEELMLAVYADMRRLPAAKMARQQPGHTLQATALVEVDAFKKEEQK